jgi:hypothetical protein
MTERTSDIPKPKGARLLAGGLATLLISPFFVGISLALADGAVKSLSGAVMVGGSMLALLAFPAHFFFGYRAPWILQVMVIILGLTGAAVGIVTPRWDVAAFGVLLAATGVVWHAPERVPGPVGRYLSELKSYFVQRIGS